MTACPMTRDSPATLSKDKDGRVVRQRAHVLIAAARCGVPDKLLGDCYAVNRKLTVVCRLVKEKSRRTLALKCQAQTHRA